MVQKEETRAKNGDLRIALNTQKVDNECNYWIATNFTP